MVGLILPFLLLSLGTSALAFLPASDSELMAPGLISLTFDLWMMPTSNVDPFAFNFTFHFKPDECHHQQTFDLMLISRLDLTILCYFLGGKQEECGVTEFECGDHRYWP